MSGQRCSDGTAIKGGQCRYPLGRTLYVNALRSTFADPAFAAQQRTLFSAFQDRSVVDGINTANNFIAVPGSGSLPLDTFTATNCAP